MSNESMTTTSKTLNVNATLSRAKSHAKKGQLDESMLLYHRVLEAFPLNQQAKKGLKALQKGQETKKNLSGPSQAQIDAIITLYSQGHAQEALSVSETLIKDYPKEPLLYNISGACYQALGQLDAAVNRYEQALAIKPDFAEAHNNLGNTLKELGQLDDAIKSFEKTLTIKPDFAEGYSNLGVTLHELGQLDAAVKCYEQALAIKLDYAEAHYNLGNTLKELGQLDAAVKRYEQALAIKPDYAGAHCNLGITLQNLHQLATAVKRYKQALTIKPNYAEAHYNLGNTLKELGELEAAVKSYEKALAIKPDYAEAHSNLGVTLRELGQLEKAVKSYEKALNIKPDYAEAHSNLGLTLKELGQLGTAAKHYDQALAINPNYAEAHSNLGITLKELGQLEKAVESYEKALNIKPDYAETHYNLGVTLNELGQLEKSVKSYEKALNIKPDYAEAHSNLGNTLKELGQVEKAVKSYEKALSIKPDYAEAKWNLSLVQLVIGSYKAGWLNYESRWQKKDCGSERHYPQPFWDGSSLAGKTLFLHSEQGTGDMIQFIRYVKVLSTKTTKIIVECPKSLHRLFSTVREINVLVTNEDLLPDFDFYAPLLSLPCILNTTLKTIPVYVPYLFADDHIASPIVTQPKVLNIGIVWAGNPSHINDKNRSINLSFFSAITNIHDTQFYSLQVGDRKADLNQEVFAPQIIDVGNDLGDYAETATVINQLDLIITVDTSVAHLAGAMGKPVWVLLPFAPDWRWLLERDDSPWYPTMRLFRQQERGNWATVFNEVSQSLEAYHMTIPKDLDLSKVLSSTINLFKAGNISEGNEKLTDLLGLLDSTTGGLPKEKILALKPLLHESLNRLKNRDYLGVADILEKDVTLVLGLPLSCQHQFKIDPFGHKKD
jgi:tetratricopeptide (TPR) repeat protein